MSYYTTGIGAMYGKIVSGTTTVITSGTAVRITSTSTPCGGVWVSGDVGNSSVIYVGDSSVSGVSGSCQGIACEPAGNSIFIPVNNLNLLYVDAGVNGDKAVWGYVQPNY